MRQMRQGTQILFSRVANKVRQYRKSENAVDLEFNDEDREEQKKAMS